MATAREIRRAAFTALFQLDARGEEDAPAIREMLADEEESLSESERTRAFELASLAFAGRAEADAAVLELAPTWPTHRQPSVDRAILRLAYHELAKGSIPAPIVLDEAVELARDYSTEKSPNFVNAVLDKVARRLGRLAEPAPQEQAD